MSPGKLEEWKKLGFWNQAGMAFGVVGVILTIIFGVISLVVSGMSVFSVIFYVAIAFFLLSYFALLYSALKQRGEINGLNNDISTSRKDASEYKEQIGEKSAEIDKLKTDAAMWRSDCKFLYDWKNDLEYEVARLQNEILTMMNACPDAAAKKITVSYSKDAILVPRTQRDARIVEIARKLNEAQDS